MATDLSQYVSDALRTENGATTEIQLNTALFTSAMTIFISAGTILDMIKKNVFYGRELELNACIEQFKIIIEALDFVNGSDFNLSDTEHLNVNSRIFHSIVGIATEATELMENLQTQGGEDKVNLFEEFGDICWYMAIAIDEYSGNFDNILKTNIEKLRARYPEKFTSEKAINRNIDSEKEILSDNLN